MRRIQFTVGGGKKCRQRFAPDLEKQLSQALRAVGFEEDRGASAVLECQGTFKRQHDTDKDLIFMHVFPRVVIAEAEAAAAPATGVLDSLAPDHLISVASLDTFQKMVRAKIRSFAQRRRALKALKDAGQMVAALEEKMAALEQLSSDEEALYSNIEQVDEKCEWLQGELEAMVTEGQLTKEEATKVKGNMEEKTEKLRQELISAQAESKVKKVAKLEAQLETVGKSLAGVEKALGDPVVYSLKAADQMVGIRVQLLELDQIANSKQLLDVSEVKKLHAQGSLQEQLEALEKSAEEWFQDPELHITRLQELGKRADKAFKSAGSKKGKKTDGWSTVAKKR